MSDEKFRRWEKLNEQTKKIESNERSFMESSLHDIDEILSSFMLDDGRYMISYEQLSTMSFNEWFDSGRGVKFMRVYNPDFKVYYITEMNPKDSPTGVAEFGIQIHNCDEECEVLEGHLIEKLDRDKEYPKGKTVYYPAYYKHKPLARVKSKYGVAFIEHKK